MMMPTADAFVAGGVLAQQHSAPAALRGAEEALVQPSSMPCASGLPTLVGVAAGVTAVGGLAGAAARGAGHRRRAANVVRNFNKEQQLGAQDPLGFWDPLGYCKDEASFRDYRIKELKHGRLAMMGALGMLTQSLVQVPGMEGVPKSVNAIFVGNGMVGGLAVFALIGVLEASVFVQDEQKEPGNFGNPVPWFDDYSDEMRARELNNGRIAMFAAIGQIAAGLYTGKDALEQFGL
jgi:light-harvesting complex I chlorophyll a/b binding protein 1